MRNLIETMQNKNNQDCATCKKHLNVLSDKLLNAEKEQTRATREKLVKIDKKHDKEIELEQDKRKIRSITNDIERENREIARLNSIIATERQRQSNAVYDLIPFHGIFAAIISGDAKRAIPLHSQIDGLISAIANQLDLAQNRWNVAQSSRRCLLRKSQVAQSSIDSLDQEICGLDKAITECNQKIKDCDSKIQWTGKQLSK
ncbi:hypothetical protein THRCLA_10053, partial [Thraustotheca clavata]